MLGNSERTITVNVVPNIGFVEFLNADKKFEMQDFSHIKCSRFEEKSYFTALDLRCVKVKHCIKSNTNHFEGKLHRFFPGLFSDSYTSQIANLKKKKIGKKLEIWSHIT